jgi:hypothetical protein
MPEGQDASLRIRYRAARPEYAFSGTPRHRNRAGHIVSPRPLARLDVGVDSRSQAALRLAVSDAARSNDDYSARVSSFSLRSLSLRLTFS